MESGPDLNEVVTTYIEVIKQDSPEAAAAIEEILVICGLRAALRATLVVTLSKMEYLENHAIQNVSSRSDLIQEFPEARPVLERALTSCLLAWETARMGVVDQANATHTRMNGKAAALASERPSVEQ